MRQDTKMKLVVAITGASGVELGKKFVNNLPSDIQVHVVVSNNALCVESFEHGQVTMHNDEDIAASISSGSFHIDAVAIVPCSMNTLAKISCGIADNLVTRVASVAIKEKRAMLLAPREMPFSSIALENMKKLSDLGIIISPPVMAYYSNIESIEDMEKFIIGRWYDSLGISNNLFERWGE